MHKIRGLLRRQRIEGPVSRRGRGFDLTLLHQSSIGRLRPWRFFVFRFFGVTLTWREGHELFQSLALSLLHAVRVSFGHPNIGMS